MSLKIRILILIEAKIRNKIFKKEFDIRIQNFLNLLSSLFLKF